MSPPLHRVDFVVRLQVLVVAKIDVARTPQRSEAQTEPALGRSLRRLWIGWLGIIHPISLRD